MAKRIIIAEWDGFELEQRPHFHYRVWIPAGVRNIDDIVIDFEFKDSNDPDPRKADYNARIVLAGGSLDLATADETARSINRATQAARYFEHVLNVELAD